MKFNKLIVDSSYSRTELCDLGVQYPTDKSPYTKNLHRHPYTAIYDLLFFPLKNKKITFAELGIYENQSIKCWREYFKNANIFAFDNDQKLIDNALEDNITNTSYAFMDVSSSQSIQNALKNVGVKFDVILDDSSHKFDDQINIIHHSYSFIKPGGMLIIEDIFRRVPDQRYIDAIGMYEKYFDKITFFVCEHQYRNSEGWDNDKLLVMVRNDNL